LRPSYALALFLLAVALATSACGKGAAPTSPAHSLQSTQSSPMTADVAEDIAAQFGKSIALQGGVPTTGLGTTTFQAIARDQAPMIQGARPLNAMDDANFSWSFTVHFFDAAGNEQTMFVQGETARLSAAVRAHGELMTNRFHSDFGTLRTLDVAGLLPADTTIEIDGALHDTANAVFMPTDSTGCEYHVLANGALVDVIQDKDKSRNPFPLSGTATWMASVDRVKRDGSTTKSSHFEVTVVVTFNGTRHPDISVNKIFHFQTDLETGQVTRRPT
jgi:hypothetical protein